MHSLEMTGQQFLRALLDARRLNPNSMGEKAGNHALQSTAARFLRGMQSRPSTMQPIADFFGVDVGGFFDPDKADAELQRLGLALDGREQQVNEPAPAYKSNLRDALEQLANALNALPDEKREIAAERLQILAMAPDSKKALDSVRVLLGVPTAAAPFPNAPAQLAERMAATPPQLPKVKVTSKKTEKA